MKTWNGLELSGTKVTKSIFFLQGAITHISLGPKIGGPCGPYLQVGKLLPNYQNYVSF
jgi:hypothetical protein